MTKDRLQDLQAVLRKNRAEDESCDWGRYGAINQAIDIELDEDAGYMDNFFREVEQVRSWIEDIKLHVTEMKQIHDQLLLLPRPDEQMKQQLEDKTETVKQIAKNVNKHLKCMEQRIKNESEESEGGGGAVSTGFRIRKTQYNTLLHLFVEAVTQFNLQQVYYKDKFEKRVQRVISLAKAQISDEKLEEILEQGDYNTIFNGDIITETKKAQKVLEVAQKRQEELLKLEKSIIELSNLFSEMAMLVDQQGDMINSIERHVIGAKEYVEVAKFETKRALQYKEKARKLKLIIFASILLVVCLLIAWTIYKFYPRKS
ncbi:syntaxin-1A [Nilaparvata lugens]|uniref:syntaxin-1A n=1 Tax=Nilaparvata lugens TaxID=108931 RepID=UPI00193CBEF3|nr:syntaxin-1A [Nilaparvata lugens]